MGEFGKKGGTSATANRKAVTYVGTFPDGKSFKKRAFFATGPAFAACYQHKGTWFVAGIDQRAEDMQANYTPIPVTPTA